MGAGLDLLPLLRALRVHPRRGGFYVRILQRPMSLSAAHRKKLREVFDALDTDGSDDLDYDELKAALTQFGVKITLAELKQLWIDADKDASSGINFDEFVNAVERLPKTLSSRKESMQSLQATLGEIAEKKKTRSSGKKKKKGEEAEEEQQQQCQVM